MGPFMVWPRMAERGAFTLRGHWPKRLSSMEPAQWTFVASHHVRIDSNAAPYFQYGQSSDSTISRWKWSYLSTIFTLSQQCKVSTDTISWLTLYLSFCWARECHSRKSLHHGYQGRTVRDTGPLKFVHLERAYFVQMRCSIRKTMRTHSLLNRKRRKPFATYDLAWNSSELSSTRYSHRIGLLIHSLILWRHEILFDFHLNETIRRWKKYNTKNKHTQVILCISIILSCQYKWNYVICN